jgi:hypothetical protein
MTAPNADPAIIAPEKITRYLLNMSHKRGSPKARLLLNLGYRYCRAQEPASLIAKLLD